jgi:hypothetical protein
MSGARRTITIRQGPPAQLPQYVERGGEIVPRQPSVAIDARLYGFTISADSDRIDEFCARVFNKPSGGEQHWQSATDWVLLSFVDIPELRSGDPLDSRLGSVHEREAAIWMPIRGGPRGDAQQQLRWAIPYIFVDSEWALVGGREPYGFPKQLGTVHLPRDEHAPQTLDVHTTTVKTFGPAARARDALVVRASRASATPFTLDPAWRDHAGMLASVVSALTSVPGTVLTDLVSRIEQDPLAWAEEIADQHRALTGFARDMGTGTVAMLLLKQFRDALSPALACYQAIVEVANELKQFRRGGFLPDDYRVDFAKLDGEPILRELGIAEGPQKPGHAFWLEFDFSIEATRVVWPDGS